MHNTLHEVYYVIAERSSSLIKLDHQWTRFTLKPRSLLVSIHLLHSVFKKWCWI